MKKRLLLVVAVFISIVFATTVFAQEPTVAPGNTAAKDTKEVKAAAPKAKKMRAKGEVVSVDAAAKTMVVKSKKGEITFDISNAKFGKHNTMEDMKAGDKVKVVYKEIDGKMVAKYVKKHHHGKKNHKKATNETQPMESKPATPVK